MAVDLTSSPIVSADSHVNEPHDLWFERLPARLRDRAPRRIQQTPDGPWEIVLNGSLLGWADLDAEEAARMEAEREAEASADVRLAMLATEGISAEVVYPTIGLYVWSLPDAELGVACCRAYNDWMFEHLGDVSPRVRLAAMIPTWSPGDAVAEIERSAARGFAAALLPIVGSPEWNHRQWEPLWSAITEAGLPAAMHQGTGHDMIWVRGPGAATTNLVATQAVAPRTATLLAASGVLERHPDLRVVLVEVNAGWMAWTMHTADEYYLAHAHWSTPKLAEPPSHYLRAQVHATFQRDPVGVANRGMTGVDCLMWGGDYPHPETTYPHSLRVLGDLFADVGRSDAAAIAGGTAARVFGFDIAALAATVGGTARV
jgi:predicted TIM-barrel fold metal-dependent hydrolase